MNHQHMIATCIALSVAACAQAAFFSSTLDVNSMPSAQGCSYFALNSGLTESQVFAPGAGVMTINTIGNGYQSQGGNLAIRAADHNEMEYGMNWAIEARVRVLSGELWSFHYGFCLAAEFDGMSASLGIMPSTYQHYSLQGGVRDNTQWTTWRLETDRDAGIYRVYADGSLLAAGALYFGPSSPGFPDHYVAFGDGTGGANAHAEVSSLTFRQFVPTPGAACVLSLFALAARRRR